MFHFQGKIASIILLLMWMFSEFIYSCPNSCPNECIICSFLILLHRNGKGYPAWGPFDLNLKCIATFLKVKPACLSLLHSWNRIPKVCCVCLLYLPQDRNPDLLGHSLYHAPLRFLKAESCVTLGKIKQSRKTEDSDHFVNEGKADDKITHLGYLWILSTCQHVHF